MAVRLREVLGYAAVRFADDIHVFILFIFVNDVFFKCFYIDKSVIM